MFNSEESRIRLSMYLFQVWRLASYIYKAIYDNMRLLYKLAWEKTQSQERDLVFQVLIARTYTTFSGWVFPELNEFRTPD